MSSEQEEKDELSRLIRESKRKGQEIAKRSSDLVQWGQHTSDLADASMGVLKYIIPNGVDWEPKKRAWRYHNQQQDAVIKGLVDISIPTATTSGTATVYSMSDFANLKYLSNFVAPDKRNEVTFASQKLSNVIERQTEKDRVVSLLQQYGLAAAASGQKSPNELFQTAWAAFEKPVAQVSSDITFLIPIRECLNGVVAELLRRRHKQERTSKNRDKILSIGKELAGSAIPQSAIAELANHYEELVDKLSESKQRSCSREEGADFLRRATLFLRELLESLDKSKVVRC